MKIPEPENTTIKKIDQWHEQNQSGCRPHMGVSTIGHKCERYLWLSFRFAVATKFNGRMLRLFRRGQNEEITIVQDLRRAGVDITTHDSGRQIQVDFGSHVSGSLDGIINRGLVEAPKTKHVAEFKTHSLKSFTDLVKKGVKESKPMHYTQMQVYMLGTGIDRAFYLAVCKDNDEIYTERVRLDSGFAQAAVDRAKRIALSNRMPPPISTDPTWFECKMCDMHEFCHESRRTKQVNCRTCINSTARDDSTWHCDRYDVTIPFANQKMGCNAHIFHIDLVDWDVHESSNQDVVAWVVGDSLLKNGEPDNYVYSSVEIAKNLDACLANDPIINSLREMGGRIDEIENEDIPF